MLEISVKFNSKYPEVNLEEVAGTPDTEGRGFRLQLNGIERAAEESSCMAP